MYQKMIIVGRVGNKPELSTTKAGTKVARFRLAENHIYTINGERQQETTWFHVNVWGRSAEIAAQFAQIGGIVLVEGRMMPNENGNPRQFELDGELTSRYEISASNFRLISGKDVEGVSLEEFFGAQHQ